MTMEQGDTASDPDDLPSLNFVFEQVEKRFEVQWNTLDSLDTKIGLLFGFGGVILAALLGAYGWLPDMPSIPLFLFFAAIMALVISLVLAFFAYRPRVYDYPPEPRRIREEYVSRPLVQSKLALVDTRVTKFEQNERILRQKARMLSWALGALLIGVCLLALSFLSFLFCLLLVLICSCSASYDCGVLCYMII